LEAVNEKNGLRCVSQHKQFSFHCNSFKTIRTIPPENAVIALLLLDETTNM
jgi:hypothetical protein